VAFYRISDDHKQDTIPDQRAWARRVCQRNNLSLVNEFEDSGVSGSDVIRPGLEQLLAFFKQRFFDRQPVRYLLMKDFDRFIRRDSLATGSWLDRLRQHGLRYVTTTDQEFDLHKQMDRTQIALGSEFTREPFLRSLSGHVMNSMAERARLGLWMGGQIPYAYRVGADGHLTPGPEEVVEVLKWIFSTYASGRLTATGVARALNERGVQPPKGTAGRWCQKTVLKILRNRVYLGCTSWGGRPKGKYHRLDKGFVVPREDKEDREEVQLLRGLKKLPEGRALDADRIFCPNAHTALIDAETFQACEVQRANNTKDLSRPREYRVNEEGKRDKHGKGGRKGECWPLAGQIKCGHCGKPVWMLPYGPSGNGEPTMRARLMCRNRRDHGAEACPESGMIHYQVAVSRVINLVQKKLTGPGALDEWLAAVEATWDTRQETTAADRQRLETRVADLDRQIGTAAKNLLQFPDDLKADAFEHVRALKAQRDAAAQELRDLDAAARDSPLVDMKLLLEGLEATRTHAFAMPDTWATREEAERARERLRGIVGEVRLYWRARTAADKLPPSQNATRRLLRRVEVDLTPPFADLATTATRGSPSPPRRPPAGRRCCSARSP
jgi:DNA invertase Pin-like site-specific DNA recombinase